MGKNLVLVESPAKAETIRRYLGKEFRVLASIGHIKDLPKKSLGVRMDGKFTPQYGIIASKRKVVEEIRSSGRDSETIYIATDPDREGEAIGWHLWEILGKGENVKRALFSEITRDAVLDGIRNASSLNSNLVESQITRRVLDRLMGYRLSPLLWQKVREGLSAGRVQSVALLLICEREKEIVDFVPEEYWRIFAHLQGPIPPPFAALLTKRDGKKVKIRNREEAEGTLSELEGLPFYVKRMKRGEKREHPPPPFITSTLQQSAYRVFGWTAKKTMAFAQSLYEGVDIGEKRSGLITYMRTDSTRIEKGAVSRCREFIEGAWGIDFLPPYPRVFKSRRGAQEAHEAIRPTDVRLRPDDVKGSLKPEESMLYTLIWKRFVACQMAPALFDAVTLDLQAGRYLFTASGKKMLFQGYKILFEKAEGGRREKEEDREKGGEEDELEGMEEIPPLPEGERCTLIRFRPQQEFTRPPVRYNEALLIKALEEKGIGRPSTYAQILSTIQERVYIKRIKGRFFPTDLGMTVSTLLSGSFPEMINEEFTRKMEEKLDLIEEGKEGRAGILREFYEGLEKDLERAKERMPDIKREGKDTGFICRRCGGRLVMKWHSKMEDPYLICSSKDCRHIDTVTYDSEGRIAPEEGEEEQCEVCQAPMIKKTGRYGLFLSCSRYPRCSFKKSLNAKAAAMGSLSERARTCPNCGREMVLKRGRFGPFLACPAYPRCRTTLPLKRGKRRGG